VKIAIINISFIIKKYIQIVANATIMYSNLPNKIKLLSEMEEGCWLVVLIKLGMINKECQQHSNSKRYNYLFKLQCCCTFNVRFYA
jgi:hypothetical protein